MISESRFRQREHGAGLFVMIIGTIVLAGTLVYILAAPRFAANPLHSRNVAAQLAAQAQYIQQQIYRCAAEYPEGDRLARLNNALPAEGANSSIAVSNLTCPGNRQNLWAGGEGDYRIQQPVGFGGWTYQNNQVSGVINIAIASIPGRDMSRAIALAVAKLGGTEAYSTGTPATTLYVRIVN